MSTVCTDKGLTQPPTIFYPYQIHACITGENVTAEVDLARPVFCEDFLKLHADRLAHRLKPLVITMATCVVVNIAQSVQAIQYHMYQQLLHVVQRNV